MFEPKNEMGVIVVFAQQAHLAGIEIVKAGIAFPDLQVRYQGKLYAVEAEYVSSNFVSHGHDPVICDWILCWNHDLIGPPLPVIELSDPGWYRAQIGVMSQQDAEVRKLRHTAKIFNPLPCTGMTVADRVSEQRRDLLLNMLIEHGDLGATEFGRRLGVARGTVYNDLSALESAGRIHKNGNGVEILG